MEDELKIDFDHLDRTLRAITMIADSAIQILLDAGWTRKRVNIEINPDEPLPCWVTLKKKRVYEVSIVTDEDGTLKIQGEWIKKFKAPGFIDYIFGR